MNYKSALHNTIFEVISKASVELNVESYVIGGFVRDLLLGRKFKKDIDIVAVGSGIELALKVSELLPKKPKVQVFKNYGTAMLRFEDTEIEFVGARKESYHFESRNPVVENGTLEDDQNRRDFTINALALSLNPNNYGDLVDPFNGVLDLENKTIKTPLDPDITYSDDPLRMMRAIRFATQLGFEIEANSLASITKNAERISIISGERIVDELNKIISTEKPSTGFLLLYKTGLLDIILPELTALNQVEEIEGHTHKNNFYHTLEVVDNICPNTNDVWLRWSALLHDIGKAPTKRFNKKQGWTFHGHEFLGGKMAKKIFERYGYTGARMQMIADEAAISKASLHYYFRSKEKWKIVSLEEKNDEVYEIESEDDILGYLSKQEILLMIQELPPSYRLVFNLYVFEGLKHKEIAEQLGIGEGTSKSNLADARRILQKKLSGVTK